jgi:hypothetical protein
MDVQSIFSADRDLSSEQNNPSPLVRGAAEAPRTFSVYLANHELAFDFKSPPV